MCCLVFYQEIGSSIEKSNPEMSFLTEFFRPISKYENLYFDRIKLRRYQV